jgi:hypothetical protein
MSTLANYREQQAAFAALLEPHCERRILMFRGESGSGKTALMTACRASVMLDVSHLAMDLRGSTVNVPEILSRSVIRLGGLAKLRNFTARVAALSRVPALNLADNTLKGTQNQIEVVVKDAGPIEREERYVQLTEAWFQDLEQIERPLLMILDTYEQANQEVQDWIGGPLLGRAADTHALRVALAGQQVPDTRIDWSHCCEIHDLYGVKEAHHWLPVVEALGYRVPVEPPEVYLAGICLAREGNPGEIMKIIKTFPRRH